MEKKVSESKWAHFVAIAAIIGSVLTPLVSGHFAESAAKLQAEQARELIESQNSKFFFEQFAEKTEPVAIAFNDMFLYASQKEFNFEIFAAKADVLSMKAAALMPYVSGNLYLDIDDVARTAAAFARQDERLMNKSQLDDLKQKMNTFMVNYFVYRDSLVGRVPGSNKQAPAPK